MIGENLMQVCDPTLNTIADKIAELIRESGYGGAVILVTPKGGGMVVVEPKGWYRTEAKDPTEKERSLYRYFLASMHTITSAMHNAYHLTLTRLGAFDSVHSDEDDQVFADKNGVWH
jgi:hypothetical protein